MKFRKGDIIRGGYFCRYYEIMDVYLDEYRLKGINNLISKNDFSVGAKYVDKCSELDIIKTMKSIRYGKV